MQRTQCVLLSVVGRVRFVLFSKLRRRDVLFIDLDDGRDQFRRVTCRSGGNLGDPATARRSLP